MSEIHGTLRDLQADVMGLEEVDRFTSRGKNVDQPVALAGALGYQFAFAHEANVEQGEEGVAILSRWPLSDVRISILEEDPDFHFVELEAKVNAPAPTPGFTFAVTHLSWLAQDARIRQVAALKRLVQNVRR